MTDGRTDNEFLEQCRRIRRHRQRLSACIVGFGLVLGVGAFARTPASHPYEEIHLRNPFGLKEPATLPPPPTPVPEAPPPGQLKLTGISSLSAIPRAMFVLTLPGEPEKLLSIREGQTRSGIEVLEQGIDLNARSVRIRRLGREEVITFAKAGAPVPSLPSPSKDMVGRSKPVKQVAVIPKSSHLFRKTVEETPANSEIPKSPKFLERPEDDPHYMTGGFAPVNYAPPPGPPDPAILETLPISTINEENRVVTTPHPETEILPEINDLPGRSPSDQMTGPIRRRPPGVD